MLARYDAVVRGEECTECWPENWQALQVFSALQTQWNVGMNGAIGLRYEALPVVLNLLEIQETDRAGIFNSLRIMESEALSFFRNANG